MLMHNLLERFYNYLIKITDKKINKIDAEAKRKEEFLAKIYPDGIPSTIPKYYEAKNPYRFM